MNGRLIDCTFHSIAANAAINANLGQGDDGWRHRDHGAGDGSPLFSISIDGTIDMGYGMHERMRILLAEDDSTTRGKLAALLGKWGYDVVVARDGLESWSVLESEDSPLLAVLDWMMPGIDGIEICRRLRADKTREYVYVVLLTGNCSVSHLVAGLDAGADDYVTKPFEPQELQVRLRAGRRIVELEQALRKQALRDPLTQAWNRRALLNHLQRELPRVEQLAVIMVDLDSFKQINDTHGHDVGDAVLVEATRRLTQGVRSTEEVGRYGGEEFMVIVSSCDGPSASLRAELLRRLLAQEPVEFGALRIAVTGSFGVAASTPGTSLEALVRAADMALYRAKANGRNRVETSAP